MHGTHSSTVENNVLYNVRGAGIYIEDGNEMYNDIKYNVGQFFMTTCIPSVGIKHFSSDIFILSQSFVHFHLPMLL